MQKITESIRPIVSTLQHVTIQKEAIQDFATHYAKASHEEKATSLEGYLENATEEEHIAFVIVTSAINFCFWGEPKWAIKIGDKKLGGSLSMFYCIKRAYEEGLKMTDPIVLAALTEETLTTVFKGENTIPLLPERAQLLRELGQAMQKDQLHFLDLVNEAHWDAIELVELLAKRFPSVFRDVYTFEEKELHFYKRAQLVPHLLSNLHKQGFISKDISNIKDLSALADYKVPQMLRQLGILSYNEPLAKTIHEKKELPEQSREEIEIRVATIEAIDQIIAELQRLGCSSSAAEVDHFLWTQSQNNDATIEPYHRTRTIWY